MLDRTIYCLCHKQSKKKKKNSTHTYFGRERTRTICSIETSESETTKKIWSDRVKMNKIYGRLNQMPLSMHTMRIRTITTGHNFSACLTNKHSVCLALIVSFSLSLYLCLLFALHVQMSFGCKYCFRHNSRLSFADLISRKKKTHTLFSSICIREHCKFGRNLTFSYY